MPYHPEVSPIRVDLSALGQTPEGAPFYAVIHTWRSLPHPELRALIQQYPEILRVAADPSTANAQELLISPAYPAMGAALVVEWNLTEPLTDEPLAVPQQDPSVIDRVPMVVWQTIIAALGRLSTSAPPTVKTRLRVVPPAERS